MRKGDKLYVEGKVRYRTYDDKQGKRRYVTEIYVDNMEMLVSKFAASRTNEANNAQTAAKAEAQTSQEEKEQDSLPF